MLTKEDGKIVANVVLLHAYVIIPEVTGTAGTTGTTTGSGLLNC